MSANHNSLYAKLMTLAVIVLFSPCCHGQSTSEESVGVIADSVVEFSGEQGNGGWYYGYWDRAIDSDDKFDPSSDFKVFKHFGTDVRNGLRGHEAFKTGDLWYLEDGRFYTSIWANGGHANSAVQLGDYSGAEHWSVRRWVSNSSGTVTISGRVGKVMPWGANWGGECQAIIMVDGVTVLSTVMDEHGIDYTVAVKIQNKSRVDFLIAPNPSIGVVTFTATIRKRALHP